MQRSGPFQLEISDNILISHIFVRSDTCHFNSGDTGDAKDKVI